MKGISKKIKNLIFEKWHRLARIKPCYVIVNKLNNNSVAVDIGTGDNADFSQSLIKKFGLKSYGFDPTKKHLPALKALEAQSDGHFKIFDCALCAQKGEKIFYESLENISGSLHKGHTNILQDTTKKYTVNAVTLADIFEIIEKGRIDLLKMDIEGEEYDIIESTDKSVFDKIGQMIIEFHHHCIANKSLSDTAECINTLKKMGFTAYTIDNINYLFFKKQSTIMKKTAIILKTSSGARLTNQLWNFISIYAYCLEKGYECKNYSFFEEKKHKDKNNSYTYYNYYKFFNIPSGIFAKLLILSHLAIAKICKRVRFYDRFAQLVKKKHPSQILHSGKEKVFYLPPTSNQDAQQLAQLAGAEKSPKIYFDGWLFRNSVGIEKYRQEIKKYFQPNKEIINNVDAFLSPLRQEYENIVGVHIRQTDYSYFSDGKYLLEPEKIRKFLEDYLKFFKKDRNKTLFIICSDGEIDESIFKGLNIKKGPGGTIEDLYALSQTSTIIGSNSTFGAFAAYYGNIPFIVMQKNNADWDYYSDKDRFFFNKYSTFVNY